MRKCVICGKFFDPTASKVECCSLKCSKIKGGRTLCKYDYKYPPGLTERQKANYRQNIDRNIKLKTNPRFKLNEIIRHGIRQSLKGNGGSKNGTHWESLVGYTLDELKTHLEKQFQPGMSWDNHGEWHIDHKIPIAAFNFSSPNHDDFKKCWALSNLQPLWAAENLSKNARLETHFQPSLEIG